MLLQQMSGKVLNAQTAQYTIRQVYRYTSTS